MQFGKESAVKSEVTGWEKQTCQSVCFVLVEGVAQDRKRKKCEEHNKYIYNQFL